MKDAQSTAIRLRQSGKSYTEIASEMSANGFKSPRTGKPYTSNGVAFLTRKAPKRMPATTVAYERIDSLPPAPPKGLVMVIIGRPEQVAGIAQGILQ